MATLASVVFKHHKKMDGTYNPKIKVYHNGTTVYMPTQIYTPFVRFRKGESTGIITDGDIVDALNMKIREIRKILNANEHLVENCENAKAVANIIDRIMNMGKMLDYISYAKEYMSTQKENGSKTVKLCMLANLCNFLDSETLPVKKITSTFLTRFENWMLSERVVTIRGKDRTVTAMAQSSAKTYIDAFRTIYNSMLLRYNDYETGDIVIQGDPFKVYKPQRNISFTKKAVSADIIRKISGYVPDKSQCSSLILARDMFMLSFYFAGMNLIDLFNCNSYHSGRIDYMRTKTKNRKKNKAFISIPVIPEAQQLFEKYKDEQGDRVFNIYKMYDMINFRQRVAIGMNAICKNLGIAPVTFYAARHSFATIARNECNVSMDDIALCLTHSSGYNVTDTYIKPDFSRVDAVIRKVVDYVFNKK